jgi:ferredoxin
MEQLVVIEELCVGCGQCALVCEFEALETQWGRVKVDEDLCVLCGACLAYCPVDALAGEGP